MIGCCTLEKILSQEEERDQMDDSDDEDCKISPLIFNIATHYLNTINITCKGVGGGTATLLAQCLTSDSSSYSIVYHFDILICVNMFYVL